MTEKVAKDTYLVDLKPNGHDSHTASYVLRDGEVGIIDTGFSSSVDRILNALDELGISRENVSHVITTHIHLDHAGGSGFLLDKLPNAKLYCHENGYPFFTDKEKASQLVESVHRAVGKLASRYGDFKTVSNERIEKIHDSDSVRIGNRELEAIYTHGHAPHQLCLYDTDTHSLFSADEAGRWLYGELLHTSPPPNFDLETNLDSLDRLSELELERILYPHFGGRNDPYNALEQYRDVLSNWVRDVKKTYQENDQDRDRTITEFQERDNHLYNHWEDVWVRESIRMNVEGVLLYLENKEEI